MRILTIILGCLLLCPLPAHAWDWQAPQSKWDHAQQQRSRQLDQEYQDWRNQLDRLEQQREHLQQQDQLDRIEQQLHRAHRRHRFGLNW